MCRRTFALVLLAVFVVASLAAAQAKDKRPWKREDEKRFSSVAGVTLGPKGKLVGVSLRAPGASARSSASGVTLYDAATGKVMRKVTGASSVRFTPDGTKLIYSSSSDPARAKARAKAKEGEKKPARSARWQRMMQRLKKQGGGAAAPAPTRPTRSRARYLTVESIDGKQRHTWKGIREHVLTPDGKHLVYVKAEGSSAAAFCVHDMAQATAAKDRTIFSGEDQVSGLSWQEKLGVIWFYSDRMTEAEAAAAKKAAEKVAAAKKAASAKKAGSKKNSTRKTRAKKKPADPAEPEAPPARVEKPKKPAKKPRRELSDSWPAAEPEGEGEGEKNKTGKGKREKEKGKKKTVTGKGGEKTTKKTVTAKAAQKKPAAPKRPMRLWSFDPKTGQVKPLLGPGIGKYFPAGQTLSSSSMRVSGMSRGRTIPAALRARMMSMRSGGVTLAKDGKRLFVRTRAAAKPSTVKATTPVTATARRPGATTAATAAKTAAKTAATPAKTGVTARRTSTRPTTTRSTTTRSRAPRKPEVVVWHWRDNKVPTEAAKQRTPSSSTLWEVDLASGVFRLLTNGTRRAQFSPDQQWLLDLDSDPYTAFTSWDRGYADAYLTSVKTLKRERVLTKLASGVRFTSDGKHLLWFEDGDWHAMALADRQRRNLTAKSGMKLGDRGHGGAILMPGGRSVLLADEFDVWQVPLDGAGIPTNLTKVGRRDGLRFRPAAFRTDSKLTATERYFEDGRLLHLQSFNRRTKAMGYFSLDLTTGRLEKLIELDRYLSAPRQAKNGDLVAFTVQDFNEYPDVWVSDRRFRSMRKLTDANPWLAEIDLPENRLIEWRSLDGTPLQGILTLPAGYQSGKRYPMIVYIYEKLSDNLHRWRSPKAVYNVPRWAAAGYAVFQPDIEYEIGHPGRSSVKCVLPGVDKVVQMGIADSDRIGLIGHSWGGYETAYIVTQTRRFAAAVAGAPVVNMTSAYNGIRWSSGKPRQFQYERTQSRIGGSLWEYPERFMANSPVFHLESMTTPMLILFGDNDGAVPWYQGIEYMLALRRLGKKAVFLQYKGEGHGLRRSENKEDYDQRVMAWFDHFLKGVKAKEWITEPGH